MKTLHLLRHAKSSWDDLAVPDDQRPLAARGERAAAALCEHFAAIGLELDLVLCSPALRARQTWTAVRSGVRGEPRVRIEPAIYEASPMTLMALVRKVDERNERVLMIGHNPGFAELALLLATDDESSAVDALQDGVPTGGFLTFNFAGTWSGVREGIGRLTAFVRPRDLTD
jgi:phosphohistidine phosphatase